MKKDTLEQYVEKKKKVSKDWQKDWAKHKASIAAIQITAIVVAATTIVAATSFAFFYFMR